MVVWPAIMTATATPTEQLVTREPRIERETNKQTEPVIVGEIAAVTKTGRERQTERGHHNETESAAERETDRVGRQSRTRTKTGNRPQRSTKRRIMNRTGSTAVDVMSHGIEARIAR